MESSRECVHPVIEKWVTRRGLICQGCLTDADFAAYPGWRQALELRTRRAELARVNFQAPGVRCQVSGARTQDQQVSLFS